MSGATTVHVGLGDRAYDILVGAGLFERAGEVLAPILRERRVFVVTDARVAAAQWPRLQRGLAAAGIAAPLIVLPPGESSKDSEHLIQLLDEVLTQRPERGS